MVLLNRWKLHIRCQLYVSRTHLIDKIGRGFGNDTFEVLDECRGKKKVHICRFLAKLCLSFAGRRLNGKFTCRPVNSFELSIEGRVLNLSHLRIFLSHYLITGIS